MYYFNFGTLNALFQHLKVGYTVTVHKAGLKLAHRPTHNIWLLLMKTVKSITVSKQIHFLLTACRLYGDHLSVLYQRWIETSQSLLHWSMMTLGKYGSKVRITRNGLWPLKGNEIQPIQFIHTYFSWPMNFSSALRLIFTFARNERQFFSQPFFAWRKDYVIKKILKEVQLFSIVMSILTNRIASFSINQWRYK